MKLLPIVEEIPDSFYKLNDTLLLDEQIQSIVEDVKQRGDTALHDYTRQFDKVDLQNIAVTQEEIQQAFASVSQETQTAIEFSVQTVRHFAQEQLLALQEIKVETPYGILGHRIVPLEKVGVYVPGGNYPLPSSAVMTIVPAKVAGVQNIIMCSPKIVPETIVAGILSGADHIFQVGGAQAISAMAYGTASIPAVDKIVGPGSRYVNTAKMLVSAVCGIDMYAGPSEVLVIADASANPAYIAADLLAQAEHDVEASANLITVSANLARQVQEEVLKQLQGLSTKDIVEQSLQKSYIILVQTIEQAVAIANKKAPEHLEIFIETPEALMDSLKNYGSLFLGSFSAEVFGDYCSGPNHVLPTNGVARYRGGLSVYDFVKILTYQSISEQVKSSVMVQHALHLAGVEGLAGHKNAAQKRLTVLQNMVCHP